MKNLVLKCFIIMSKIKQNRIHNNDSRPDLRNVNWLANILVIVETARENARAEDEYHVAAGIWDEIKHRNRNKLYRIFSEELKKPTTKSGILRIRTSTLNRTLPEQPITVSTGRSNTSRRNARTGKSFHIYKDTCEPAPQRKLGLWWIQITCIKNNKTWNKLIKLSSKRFTDDWTSRTIVLPTVSKIVRPRPVSMAVFVSRKRLPC